MSLLSVVVLSVLAFASATDVKQCPGQSETIAKNSVQLSPCKKLPCRLKKGTNQHITVNFTSETDIPDVKNKVMANVYGLDVPFIGVDGNSICDKIFNESGEKASCPLKAGNNYIYKDSFPVLKFYPSIEVNVHWALQAKNRDIVCFRVPAKIVE